MKIKTILLADDNQNDIELILLSLKEYKNSINVEVVNDGKEALDYLHSKGKFKDRKNGLPSLILLDIKMHRMDGNEALKEIKGDNSLKLIPVVMFTSSREANDVSESYRLGVNAYVVKPVDFDQFNFAIKQLCIFWALLNELPLQLEPETNLKWKKI